MYHTYVLNVCMYCMYISYVHNVHTYYTFVSYLCIVHILHMYVHLFMYFLVYISMYVRTYVKDPLLYLLLVSLGTGTKNFLSFFLRWRVNILYQIITEGHNHWEIFYFNSDTRIGYLLAPMCWFVSWLFYLYSNRKDKYFYFD